MNGGVCLIEEELVALEAASSMEELAQVAILFLRRVCLQNGHQVIEICGPMTTGGLGSFEANMHRFNGAIQAAVSNGYVVFDLPFFQNAMDRIIGFKEKTDDYCWEILEVFLRKVFESGYITKGLFLPGWETSIGAKWEREEFQRIGIAIEEFPPEWLT